MLISLMSDIDVWVKEEIRAATRWLWSYNHECPNMPRFHAEAETEYCCLAQLLACTKMVGCRGIKQISSLALIN